VALLVGVLTALVVPTFLAALLESL
jgi:hypothetical protein